MRARGWAIAAAVLAVAGCKTSTRSGDRVGAAAAGQEQASPQQGSAAAGGTASGAGDETVGAPDRANEVTGRVALVDRQQHELAIDAGTATTQVKVAPDARITVDGQRASFGDIPQGAAVRATLDRSGETPQATEIAITHSKQAQKR